MNKSQELKVMLLRAQLNVQEILREHENAWRGQEPKMVEDIKKGGVNQELIEGVEDATD